MELNETEREIVAWLRDEESCARLRRPELDAETIAYANALGNAARAIESGSHRKEG